MTEVWARRDELATAVRSVRARIDRACAAAGRAPYEVRLMAVTKTFPATDAALLADLGVADLGENRDQEARTKVAEMAELRPSTAVRWHMVGQLQRNKARSVARWADEVQSVDSFRLSAALDDAVRVARDRGERMRPLDVLVQLSLDADTARGGCPPDDLVALANRIVELDGLRLRGVMAIAPLRADPDAAFNRCAQAAGRLRDAYPEASELSIGMSGDLEHGIAHGSTCVRVGTALLGGRGLISR